MIYSSKGNPFFITELLAVICPATFLDFNVLWLFPEQSKYNA